MMDLDRDPHFLIVSFAYDDEIGDVKGAAVELVMVRNCHFVLHLSFVVHTIIADVVVVVDTDDDRP